VTEAQLLFAVSCFAAFCCGSILALLGERSVLRKDNELLRKSIADKSDSLNAVLSSFAPPAVAAALGVIGAKESAEQRELDARIAKRETEAMFSAGV